MTPAQSSHVPRRTAISLGICLLFWGVALVLSQRTVEHESLVRLPPPANFSELPELCSLVSSSEGKGQLGPFSVTFQARMQYRAPVVYGNFCVTHPDFEETLCWEGDLSPAANLDRVKWQHDPISGTDVFSVYSIPKLTVKPLKTVRPMSSVYPPLLGLAFLAMGGLALLFFRGELKTGVALGLCSCSLLFDAFSVALSIFPNHRTPTELQAGPQCHPRLPRLGPPAPIVQLASGSQHSCALLADGRVRCWGDGSRGQLGYGTNGSVRLPSLAGDVPVGGAVAQIAAGGGHTCAVLRSGKLRCWGDGRFGQLGFGNSSTSGKTPEELGDVPVGEPVVQVAAGLRHTCALLSEGRIRCWGSGVLGYGRKAEYGNYGVASELGDVPLGGPALGLAAGAFHTCAVLPSGGVRCWGRNQNGELGYPGRLSIGLTDTPAEAGDIPNLGPATQVAAGSFSSCALLRSGVVQCWGDNDEGKLCVDPSKARTIDAPSIVSALHSLSPVRSILMGYQISCFLLTDHTLHCCGRSRRSLLQTCDPTLRASAVVAAAVSSGTCIGDPSGQVECDDGRMILF